ncbi:MAG: hypothetical protein ACK504_08415 [Bacteroidota bacterium]|jgi:hypothetical protein
MNKLFFHILNFCAVLSTIITKAQIQPTNYSVRVSEIPFKFEVFKNGSEKALLEMNNSITVQHFRGAIIRKREPYFVWIDGKADKKKAVSKAKFNSIQNEWNT